MIRVEFNNLLVITKQLLDTAKTINISSLQMDKHHDQLNDLQTTQEKLVQDIEKMSTDLIEMKPFSSEEQTLWTQVQALLKEFVSLNEQFVARIDEYTT